MMMLFTGKQTRELPAIDPEEQVITEKRHAIQSSFLARLIHAEQDELAQSQRNIEVLLQAWGKREEKQ